MSSDPPIDNGPSSVDEMAAMLQGQQSKIKQLLNDVHDLEDCREALRELGEYCGCDHVMCPDERMLQVQHIRESFDARDAKLWQLQRLADYLEDPAVLLKIPPPIRLRISELLHGGSNSD
jgi:hypothetical protein